MPACGRCDRAWRIGGHLLFGVGDKLGCTMILPEHGGVANAIGAVVGRVRLRKTGMITSPSEGLFRVHLDTGPEDFSSTDKAFAHLEAALTEQARRAAQAAGVDAPDVTSQREIKSAQIEEREVFVEASLHVEASGRPRIAHPDAPEAPAL